MRKYYLIRLNALALAAFTITACGVRVPEISEIENNALSTADMEYAIKKKVTCELRSAIIKINSSYIKLSRANNKDNHDKSILPLDWGAQINLLFEVDESSSINPGIAFNEPIPTGITKFGGLFPPVSTPQSYAFGLGGTISSVATRIDKFSPYYTIRDMMLPSPVSSWCNDFDTPSTASLYDSLLLSSDLRIEDWLLGAVNFKERGMQSSILPEPKPRVGSTVPPDTMSLEIKFVVTTNFNMTPTWKLVRLSANAGSLPLFSTGRIRTHDLLITIGPNDQKTRDTNLASQIRQSLSSPAGRF